MEHVHSLCFGGACFAFFCSVWSASTDTARLVWVGKDGRAGQKENTFSTKQPPVNSRRHGSDHRIGIPHRTILVVGFISPTAGQLFRRLHFCGQKEGRNQSLNTTDERLACLLRSYVRLPTFRRPTKAQRARLECSWPFIFCCQRHQAKSR